MFRLVPTCKVIQGAFEPLQKVQCIAFRHAVEKEPQVRGVELCRKMGIARLCLPFCAKQLCWQASKWDTGLAACLVHAPDSASEQYSVGDKARTEQCSRLAAQILRSMLRLMLHESARHKGAACFSFCRKEVLSCFHLSSIAIYLLCCSDRLT